MSEPLFIRQLVTSVLEGRIRIPAFQRGFVWDADRVAQLMDSIYKGYPFGSLLFWRTKNELRAERDLGPFKLAARPDDYPVDYVLDGQQRLTSIFAVFQTQLQPLYDVNWSDIYFDYRIESDVQGSQFLALRSDEVDSDRHFPLKTLFNTTEYGKATRALSDKDAVIIDDLASKFKEVSIPVQTFKTEDPTGVAIVFERINRLGVELDMLQLLNAWTWSDDFDLQTKFGELSDQFSPFGFQSVGEDTTLLLRCCAAVVSGDASPKTLMQLNGAEVREKFPEIVSGLEGAIDFVKHEFKVEKLENLPYATLLVPLCVFFAAPKGKSFGPTSEQNELLKTWFWRACFSLRYGRVVQRNLHADIQQVSRLKLGQESHLLDFSSPAVVPDFYEARFALNNVVTKTMILQLAQHSPLSFVSGNQLQLAPVLAAYNRTEFHHIFPKSFLKSVRVPADQQSPLANMCFINPHDNKILGGIAPSKYRSKIPADRIDEILASALIPEREMFADDFRDFINARSRLLVEDANRLMHIEPSA